MLPTTLPVSEPRTTSVRPLLIASNEMISSGALPKVAFRKPPMPGPRVLRRVLGRLADQPGERDERERREDEELDVAEIEEEIGGDRDGGQGEGAPEDLPRHAARLPRCCGPFSSIGATRSWSSGSTRS